MINPLILKFMSSFLNGDASAGTGSSATGDSGKDFLSDMQNALRTSLKKISPATHGSMKTNAVSNENGYKYFLESFKKELLAQGKPLSQIFLKVSDFPLVKEFLLQSGFSSEKVDGFLKDLKSNSPDGKINLSYFFQKASELKSPADKKPQDKIISSAAIPYIESILRDFQFTPKETDSAISAARVQGGGLNLKQFLNKLREFGSGKPLADNYGVDNHLCQKITSKMEMIGISVKNKEKIQHISPQDFISSLEQSFQNGDKNDKESSDIKRTLNGLIKRITRKDQNISSASPIKISSNYDFTSSLNGEIKGRTHNNLFDKRSVPSFGKNNTNENKDISSFLNQKVDEVTGHGTLDVNTANVKERADIFLDLNKKMGSMNPTEKANDHIQAKIGQMDAPRNTASFNLSDTVGTAEYTDNSSRGYLQASLMEQVGKQISMSVLRGDRFVNLQLKPPELGTMKIKMDMKDHTLRLSMTAEHHSVKELLLNNIHQLKEALLQQGVKLDTFDVQIDYNFGQSLNGSKEGTNRGYGTKRDLDEKEYNSNMIAQGVSVVPTNMTLGNNLLHLVA